ncbi:hypothetical protein [Thermococcus sp.]
MPVLGINITKIQIEKKGGVIGRVEVNLSPQIKEVRLGELRMPTGKVNGIEILFEYKINYRPEVASAVVEGMVFYLPPQKEQIDEILDLWEKEKKVRPEVFAEVVNFITNEISPFLMIAAKDMKIPYHIPLPRVALKPKE